MVGESNIGGPSGRKRAGVGGAVADISDINDSAGCGEAPVNDRGPDESVSPAIADLGEHRATSPLVPWATATTTPRGSASGRLRSISPLDANGSDG